MVTITLKCHHCGSNQLGRDGRTPMANSVLGVTTASVAAATIHHHELTQQQKKNNSSPPVPNAVLCAGGSASAASRVKAAASGSKKEAALPDLSATLVEPEAPAATELELDELWSLVMKKRRNRWMSIALCRAARQVVA